MKSSGIALWYHPEGYRTDEPTLMGRHAASEAWMRAYANDPRTEALHCVAENRGHFEAFSARVATLISRDLPCHWLPLLQPSALEEVDLLFRADPAIAANAWSRRRADQRAYSLCGLFHTTASHSVMDAVDELLMGPLQPWDAVVCTSHAMKGMVERELDGLADYYASRLGARPAPALKLPVIPLGVDCGRFPLDDAAIRAHWRQQLGIADDAVCVLYMGRLSYHAKSHPLPMLLGLERAAQQTGVAVHLIQAGWFSNDSIRRSFEVAAAHYAPSLTHHFLDGRDPEVRDTIWCAADLFTQLSDNIQETFGLAPLEAMAAGLPVVASDWDGFRDTVRDGRDGFLLPTYMTAPGSGRALAELHADGVVDYDLYIGAASQSTAVDVDAATHAYATLLRDGELRRAMGASGRRRALAVFDWPHIIERYRELWAELDEIRAVADEIAPRGEGAAADPRRQDPFRLFSGYPSAVLDGRSRVRLQPGASSEALEYALHSPLFYVLPGLRGQEELPRRIFERLSAEPKRSIRIDELFGEGRDDRVLRAAAWLAKAGLVRIDGEQVTHVR